MFLIFSSINWSLSRRCVTWAHEEGIPGSDRHKSKVALSSTANLALSPRLSRIGSSSAGTERFFVRSSIQPYCRWNSRTFPIPSSTGRCLIAARGKEMLISWRSKRLYVKSAVHHDAELTISMHKDVSGLCGAVPAPGVIIVYQTRRAQ